MPHAFDQPGTLYVRTLELLLADPRSLPIIFRDSGIPFYWLRKFRAGEYTNPGVNRVQYLYEFLAGAPLVKTSVQILAERPPMEGPPDEFVTHPGA